MDESQDMYIIVAEQKQDSSEMVLNVYDISCNTAENEIVTQIKVENEHGMLNDVYESLVTYNYVESDEKEATLDALLTESMVRNDEPLIDLNSDNYVEIKEELEEAGQYQQSNMEEFEADETNRDSASIEILEYLEKLKDSNEIECYETNELDNVISLTPQCLDMQSYEQNLAHSHWLKLRKLLKKEGIMVNTNKEVRREDVVELISSSNDNRNLILKITVRLLEQQVPPHLELDMNICFLNENGYFQCLYCPMEQPRETLIQQHYRTTHGPRYLFCLACDSAFRRIAHLVRHEMHCAGALAPLIRAARDYAKQVTPPSRSVKVPCQHCGKMIRSSNMQIHLKVHTNEFPFQCSLCPATFRSANTRASHERAHSGLRPYKCPHCPRAYTSRTSLQTHKETHVEDGFTCVVCGRSFNRKYTLMKHMDTHTGQLRFLCTLCGRGLSSKAALCNHMRLHSGDPAPHKCTQCGRRFPKVYLLRAHMKKKHGMYIVTRKMFFNFLPQMGTEICEMPPLAEEDCDDPEPYSQIQEFEEQ